MKAKFTLDERLAGFAAMRRVYDLPRNRMISATDLAREIDAIATKRAKGSLDEIGEMMLAEFQRAGFIPA